MSSPSNSSVWITDVSSAPFLDSMLKYSEVDNYSASEYDDVSTLVGDRSDVLVDPSDQAESLPHPASFDCLGDSSSTTPHDDGDGDLGAFVEFELQDVSPKGVSDASSLRSPEEYDNSISSGRQSSATLRDDEVCECYTRRIKGWSFRKEMTDGSNVNTVPPSIHELWRHQYLGRFKVEKRWREGPSKALTQRINVRQIADPLPRGNTKDGPHSVIHRHSRVVAFSIFRKYGLFERAHKPGGTSFHVHSSQAILLATTDVQAKGTGRSSQPGVSDSINQAASPGGFILNGARRAAISRIMEAESPIRRPYTTSPISMSTSPTVASPPDTSTDSATFTIAASGGTICPRLTLDASITPYDGLPPPVTQNGLGEEGMDLEDSKTRRSRTSHAEAFATLGLESIASIRWSSRNYVEHEHSGGGGILERIARRIRGSNFGARGKPVGPLPYPLFRSTLPPWVTLAPRSKQEERERFLRNLNEIVKGVDLFRHIPADAFRMLLPLWPCDTDEFSTLARVDGSKYIRPVEERQYLIVYYVPFDDCGDKGTQASETKRIPRSAFRVCARLVSREDFLGTDVRLPSEGLAITGPMAEAMAALPPASIREQHPGDVVIGVCSGKEKEVEFLPEGLVSIGLAMAIEENRPPRPPLPLHEEGMMDEVSPTYTLTPIGRAAVEMAWLGCLAITFLDVPSPQAVTT